MAIFRNLCVRLIPPLRDSKYFNVFLRLKSSPSLTSQKISHSRTASYQGRGISFTLRQNHLPLKTGLRFSIKAVKPSIQSAD